MDSDLEKAIALSMLPPSTPSKTNPNQSYIPPSEGTVVAMPEEEEEQGRAVSNPGAFYLSEEQRISQDVAVGVMVAPPSNTNSKKAEQMKADELMAMTFQKQMDEEDRRMENNARIERRERQRREEEKKKKESECIVS